MIGGQFSHKAQKHRKSQRHAMRTELLSECGLLSDRRKPRFVITCDELPAFCRSLRFLDRGIPGSLTSMQHRLIIGDEFGTDGAKVEEDEATESPGLTAAAIERSSASMNNTIATKSCRVRRLLEPFRRLHSTNNLQIIGSIPEKDKAEVIADTSRNLPKNQEPFDHVFTCFKEAISKNDCGDFATSISELGNALNELDDAISLYRGDVETEIMAGPYARCTIWNAYEHIEFSAWTKIASEVRLPATRQWKYACRRARYCHGLPLGIPNPGRAGPYGWS